MNKVLTVLLGIIFIFVVIAGQAHWKNKAADASAGKAPSPVEAVSKSQAKAEADTTLPDLLRYTANWPDDSVATFKQALEEKRPYKILFLGSEAMGTETTGAYSLVKQKLLDTFGENTVQVSLKTFKTTSAQFLSSQKQTEVADEKADMIIFEPFILNNNGNVTINNTKKDLEKIIDDIKAENPKTVFILQPSYPLYQAKIYPTQVADLKKYAEENNLPYLDHWTAWPDSNSDEMKPYLLPNQSAPSDKGNQVWSDYLIHYLISQ
ncbi:SGNH/GDSL hydrolase family protein [Neobacillus muris]|uniref:SGNH/GDSL hydrolase family protein n=1 Tax=Neobacillus muris TaxID=2941334 RepID=UPI0020410F50|nr:hypothetical protein [Neobacillus muris]